MLEHRRHGPARPRTPRRALLAAAALLAAGLLAAGCGGSATALQRSKILTVDRPLRTVSLLLVAGQDSAFGGFNFDGYGAGRMTVVVPLDWRVEVTCRNASTTLTHSCAVVRNGSSPAAPDRVVFGATTPDPTDGLQIHDSASFSFRATRPGRYRIADLVTAHEADGAWDWLVVAPGARPSVRT